MCLYPKLIINRKYTPTIKNKGNVPRIKDERTKYVPVGCGKCIECLKQKANGWRVRLLEELRSDDRYNKPYFVTLSFSDESLVELEQDAIQTIDKDTGEITEIEDLDQYKLENKSATLAVRRFLENYRSDFKVSLKHWLVTELGQNNTERIHIHGIIWYKTRNDTRKKNKNVLAFKDILDRYWSYGNTWIGEYVNERTVNYIVKYITKTDKKHKFYTPKILTSPGIGKSYINRPDSLNNKYEEKKTNELYKTRQGTNIALPIYYRNKIYNEDEREKLWCNRMDKEERYVLGKRIDVSKTEALYWSALKQARKKNKTLGYGNDKTDNYNLNYEMKLRNLKRLQRIAKVNNTRPRPGFV
jgi:hypothetical protein